MENGTMTRFRSRQIRLAYIHTMLQWSNIFHPWSYWKFSSSDDEPWGRSRSTQQFMKDIAAATFARDFGTNA